MHMFPTRQIIVTVHQQGIVNGPHWREQVALWYCLAGLRTEHEEVFSQKELSAGDHDNHHPKETMPAWIRHQETHKDVEYRLGQDGQSL